MDLENTDIQIRERKFSQRVDIALHLITRYPGQIFTYSLIGILPAMIFNATLIEVLDTNGYWEFKYWGVKWIMIWALTILESPFATAPLLLFLSQKIFRQKTTIHGVLSDYAGRFPAQLLFHGVYRLGLVWLILMVVTYANENLEWLMTCIFGMFSLTLLLQHVRPYVDSIIFLELLPLRAAGEGPSAGRRSRMLHTFNQNELTSESFGMDLLCVLFFVGSYGLMLWTYYAVGQDTITRTWFAWTFFAAALWLTHVFACIVRFLGYLDARIRLEGWELELRMRNEGLKRTQKLNSKSQDSAAAARSLAGSPPPSQSPAFGNRATLTVPAKPAKGAASAVATEPPAVTSASLESPRGEDNIPVARLREPS